MAAKAERKNQIKAFDKLTQVEDGVVRFVSDPPCSSRCRSSFCRGRGRLHRAHRQPGARLLPPDPCRRSPPPARPLPIRGSRPKGGGSGQRRNPVLGRAPPRPATNRTRSSSRSRRPRPRSSSHTSARPSTRTTVSGWSRASVSCRPRATSCSGGTPSTDSTGSLATTTCASCGTGRSRPTSTPCPSRTCPSTRRSAGGPWPAAHARSGDATAIGAYLGGGDVFDRAIVDFAAAYAEQNDLDHRALVDAIHSGKVQATTGV